ncbi:hypothetical protein MBLNU457_1497t1 [Dothideomycetes sp. NU457]
MGDFLTDLWQSVFTPGATPTLLLATNVTFGALQLLLFALLIATYSIHFVILSLLCGGLWWSINWFATELQAAQQKEEEAKRIRKVQSPRKGGESTHGAAGSTDTSDRSETKTSSTGEPIEFVPLGEDKKLENRIKDDLRKSGQANTGSSTAKSTMGEARQRMTASEGDISTDSEWEKVENER